MVRDWNTIKEVLEDVENHPVDDHLGLWFTNAVGNKNPAMLSALSLHPDPITEEDEHATEKWFHARMLLHAGMFITPPSQSMSQIRDDFFVLSLSLEGAALLDLLRKSDALEALNELGSKATIAAATEAAKAGMKASLRFLAEAVIGAAQTGI